MLYLHVDRTAASTEIVSSWNILPSLMAFAPACYRCCTHRLYYPRQWDIATRWRVVGMRRVLRTPSTYCALTLTKELRKSRNTLYPVRFCCHYACSLPNRDLVLRMSMMYHLVSTVLLYSNIYYPIVSVCGLVLLARPLVWASPWVYHPMVTVQNNPCGSATGLRQHRRVLQHDDWSVTIRHCLF